MKRLLCIALLTVFLCSCGGDNEQQANISQSPPAIEPETPPLNREDDKASESGLDKAAEIPEVNRPAEEAAADPAERTTDSPAESGQPDTPAARDDKSAEREIEIPEVTDDREVDSATDIAEAADEPKPEAADMIAAFPSTMGNVGLVTGDLIPEISGTDVEGVDFKLSDYQGKVIMLDFWGDW